MPASAILRMVRIMQAAPEIGILQGLIAAMPSTSAFPRLFQFGMRLRMWSFSIGNAWWQADCGPHWGTIRCCALKPFTELLRYSAAARKAGRWAATSSATTRSRRC